MYLTFRGGGDHEEVLIRWVHDTLVDKTILEFYAREMPTRTTWAASAAQ